MYLKRLEFESSIFRINTLKEWPPFLLHQILEFFSTKTDAYPEEKTIILAFPKVVFR